MNSYHAGHVGKSLQYRNATCLCYIFAQSNNNNNAYYFFYLVYYTYILYFFPKKNATYCLDKIAAK